MKFSHASVVLACFSFGGEVFGSDIETKDDVSDEDDDEAPETEEATMTYLNKHFQDLKSADAWKQYANAGANGDAHLNVVNWKGTKKDGKPCISQSHPWKGPMQSVDSVRKKEMFKLYGRYSAKKWCCSGRTATTLYGTRNVCGCIPKGEDTAGNLGLECCSNYAVEVNGKMVCGGIPPLAWTQPFVQNPYFVLQLDVNNCMYPGGGKEKEPDTTPRQHEYKAYEGFLLDLYMCGKRPCQTFGAKPTVEFPVCCGGDAALDPSREADSNETRCGCTASGRKNSKELAATHLDCCAKEYLSPKSKRTCGCIEANLELPRGAQGSDCCSGGTIDRYKKTWCREEGCIPQGGRMNGTGQHCCAGDTTNETYSQKKQCPCLSGGVKPHKKLASRCCSQKLEKDKETCSWVPTEAVIKSWFNETECFSGLADKYNKCKCMPPGSKKRETDVLKDHPEECCSGSLWKGLCSCVATGNAFGYGGDESMCCSGRAKNGVCECAEPSSAFKSALGMVKEDCCSSRASEHFCMCSKTGSKRTKSCCGKVVDKRCACIPDNYVLPSHELENASDVCCNAGDKCAITCGK